MGTKRRLDVEEGASKKLKVLATAVGQPASLNKLLKLECVQSGKLCHIPSTMRLGELVFLFFCFFFFETNISHEKLEVLKARLGLVSCFMINS